MANVILSGLTIENPNKFENEAVISMGGMELLRVTQNKDVIIGPVFLALLAINMGLSVTEQMMQSVPNEWKEVVVKAVLKRKISMSGSGGEDERIEPTNGIEDQNARGIQDTPGRLSAGGTHAG